MRLRLLFLHSFLGLLFFAASVHCGYAMQAVQSDRSPADTVSQKYGVITFEVEPDSAFLYLNNNFSSPITLTDGKRMSLPEGSYRIHIFGREISDRRFTLQVTEEEPQLLRLQYPTSRDGDINNKMYAAYNWSANLMAFSDEETEITIVSTGQKAYGLLQAKLPPGAYRIQFRDDAGKVQDRYIEVNAFELTTVEQYFKPTKYNAVIGSVLPGVSQFYKREHTKALLFIGAIGASTGLAFHYNQKLGSGADEFNSVFRQYLNAVNEQNALELGNRLDQLLQENKSLKRNRNIFRTAAILFYTANIVDAFRAPDGGFARDRPFDPLRDFSIDLNGDQIEAKLSVRF